jgi:hypothetical protein
MNKFKLLLAICAMVALTHPVRAEVAVLDTNITEAEVIAAQKGWCDALIAIGAANAEGGQEKAKALAETVIDSAYGYSSGPVLFKPTLTVDPQTFRLTRAGALAYFVGGDPTFADDTGFALYGWTACEPRNAGIIIDGAMGLTMGNVAFTAADGAITTVDKTWGFRKMDDGSVRIVLHHSSLPFTPK